MTKTRVLTLILLLGLLSLASCRKTPEKIGNNLQPTTTLITVAFDDAQDIMAATYEIPKVATTNLNYALLGNMNDPVFGITNCDFYTQISLSTESQTWGDGAVTDSVVLCLTYNGYYGDTTEYLNVRIYEVTEEMIDADSVTYYSNTTLEYNPTVLADLSFRPRPHTAPDTVLDRGVLRIPLNPSLGDYYIENEDRMTSNTEFKEFFKGLYVDCEQTNAEGSVCYFNLTHSYTYLRVYYHNNTDTLYYDFDINSSDVRFNHYEHDYSGSEIDFYDTVNNQKLYVQGVGGTRARIKFPALIEWADSLNTNVVINEAKLILTGAVTDTAEYLPPVSLVVAGAKMADTTAVILPDQMVSSDYYGGVYNAETGTVWFRISLYVQQLVSHGGYNDTDGLFIYVNNGSLMPNRWAFYGPQGETPVKLEIVYSTLND